VPWWAARSARPGQTWHCRGGGAFRSHEIEKNEKSTHFSVTVRMNNGSVRTITQKRPGFKTGDSVKIENGTLVRG
jgi:hypothetical protein